MPQTAMHAGSKQRAAKPNCMELLRDRIAKLIGRENPIQAQTIILILHLND